LKLLGELLQPDPHGEAVRLGARLQNPGLHRAGIVHILRAPMNLLPMIISSIITAAVSMRGGLGRFLAADEADLSHVIQTLPGADTAESAVLVTDGPSAGQQLARRLSA
uniref:ABC transporter permease n=1 Tax=Macrostomum lignano TaxID=282301 RepID=A0A1I8F4L8_9PLAT